MEKMPEDNQLLSEEVIEVENRSVKRRIAIALLVMVLLAATAEVVVLAYNNKSISSDEEFTKKLVLAIDRAERWINVNQVDILQRRNTALFMMLRYCQETEANRVIGRIIKAFMDCSVSNPTMEGADRIKKVDLTWPINEISLNQEIERETIDYKWMLYAIAPDKAHVTAEELELFDKEKWQHRQLTHQLFALIILRETIGPNEELNNLIEHLSNRHTSELFFDVAVVDIYIQKVLFVLMADLPQKIQRRWIERIIENQQSDGGWNDRWYCLTTHRRPKFSPAPPSDQHATLQAFTALYLVKYKYPGYFGVQ